MTIENLDNYLMACYNLDSIMEPYLPTNIELSNDLNLRVLQEQAPYYCTIIKKFLLTPRVSPNSLQAQFVKQIKLDMLKDFSQNSAMSVLYNCDEFDNLVHQISMLCMHALFMNVKDIFNIEDEVKTISLNPENVSIPIGIYLFHYIC